MRTSGLATHLAVGIVYALAAVVTEAAAAPSRAVVTGQGNQGSLVRSWAVGVGGGVFETAAPLEAFQGFGGGVSPAASDDQTGTWMALGAGPGGLPAVRVVRLVNGAPIEAGTFLAFSDKFRGGVSVAIYGNGAGDHFIVVGKGPGSAPRVRVFKLDSVGQLSEVGHFLPYPSDFRGGVTVAVGDVNGDGVPDIITGAGPGGVAYVRIFSGASDLYNPAELGGFFAYDPIFNGGVYVAAGDLNGDGRAEVITGAGAGGAPHVRVFNGASPNLFVPSVITEFLAFGPAFTGGVTVGAVAVGGTVDVVTAKATGKPKIKVFSASPAGVTNVAGFFAFDVSYRGGVSLGAVVPPFRVGALQDLNRDGQVRLVCFGDSITQGYGDNDGEPARDPDGGLAGYPTRLQGRFPEIQVINAGRGGETTGTGVGRLPDVLSDWRPDYVIVSEGANDLRTQRVDAVVSNVSRMLNQVLETGARPILGTVTPTCGPREGCSNQYSHPDDIGAANQRLIAFANDHGFAVIDFHAGFTSDPFGAVSSSSNLFHIPEGLHPNRNGYDVMGDIAGAVIGFGSP